MRRQTPTGAGDGSTDETETTQDDGDSVSAPIGVQPSDGTSPDEGVDREAGGGVDDSDGSGQETSGGGNDTGSPTAPIGAQPSDGMASDDGVERVAGGGVEPSGPRRQAPPQSPPTGATPFGATDDVGRVRTSPLSEDEIVRDSPRDGLSIEDRVGRTPSEDEVRQARLEHASQFYRGLDADDFVVRGDRVALTSTGQRELASMQTGVPVRDLEVSDGEVQLTEDARADRIRQSIADENENIYPGEVDVSITEDTARLTSERPVTGEEIRPEGAEMIDVSVSDTAQDRIIRETVAEEQGVDPSDVQIDRSSGEPQVTVSGAESDSGDSENIFERGAQAITPEPVQDAIDTVQAGADDVVRDLSGGEVGISQNFLSPDDFQELEGVSGDWTSMEDSGGFSGVYRASTRGFRSDAAGESGEYFGDIDWSFGLGGPEDEVEQFVDSVPEELGDRTRTVTSAIMDASGESAGHYVLDAAGYEGAADQYQSGLKTFGTELIPQTVEGVASLPGVAMEGTELLVTGENIGDVPAAAAVGTVGQAQYIRDNPAKGSAGIVGGTAAGFGFGRFLGTTRLGEGRTGEVMRRADLDPGQRVASGTRRGAAWARDRAPGGAVDIGDVRTGADAPVPSTPSRVDRLRGGIDQTMTETRARLPSRDRGGDLDADPVPTGRENVGTRGTGSVLDADAVDEAMGVSGPSRVDLARGRAERQLGFDSPGEPTARSGTFTTRPRSGRAKTGDTGGVTRTSELPLREQIQEAGGVRRYLDQFEMESRMGAGLVPPKITRTRGDTPDAPRDFDAGRDPTRPPDAGGTFDDVRQDALTQAQDQLRGAARRPDVGDYEPGRSPFGSDRGPIYDPAIDEVTLQQSYGTSITNADDLLDLGGTATGGGGTIFGSMGLVGGALDRQTEAERSEVLQGALAPPGSEEDTGTGDQQQRVEVGQIGFIDDAETTSISTVGEDELPRQTADTSTVFGAIEIGDVDTTTDTQTGKRPRQDTDSPIVPSPDPDPDPSPDPDPDPDPDPTQFLTPDPDPDPDPDPSPTDRDDDILFSGSQGAFGEMSSGVYTDFLDPLSGEELETERPDGDGGVGGLGSLFEDDDEDDDDDLMGMFSSDGGPTFLM